MTTFNPHADLIVIPSLISGPRGSHPAEVIFDTGANVSVFSPAFLRLIGIDPASAAVDHFDVVTASGYTSYPVVILPVVEAIGIRLNDFPVVCHTVPPNSGARGLLGLDFIRNRRLTIDMVKGTLRLK